MNSPDLRMRLKEALDNLWSRITSRFSTVDERVDDLDDAIDSVETSLSGVTSRVAGVEGRMTTAEGNINTVSGRVDDLEEAVDDIEGDMIKSISLNGTNVPKDAQGNVALQETDPNVPAWAKQQKAKTSDFTNDGDGTNNNSPFATEAYVAANGGKIDEVQVNGTPLPIVNKVVDVPVPTKTSDLVNDSGFSNMETLHMTAAAWSYVDYIFSELASELSPYEIRPFIASNATISAITNQQISPSLWGFVYTWRNTWDSYRFAGVDNVNGDIYIIEVHTDRAHYEQNIVYVDEIYKIDGGGGGGGGGGGSINGIYFNGTLIGIDTEGYVHLNEADPNVPAWAKAQTKPTYTAQEVGALPNSTTAADIGALPDTTTFVSGVKGNAESNYRSGNVNLTPANIGAVAKSGDTMNGTLTINNDSYSNGGFVRFWKDGEGGNIVIASPNGKEFQIDASNNNRIRCFAYDDNNPPGYKVFEFDRTTGVVYASGGFDGTVKKSGDTMTGPLKWGSSTALPAASSLEYFLGIDPFADGGTTHYITAANLLAAIGAAKAPTLISSSVVSAASIPFDLSAYSRIELDFSAASQYGHLVMVEKNQWYYLSYLSESASSATNLNMYAIKAKYTNSGITIDYCGYKNLSTGAWNDRIGNSGYLLRNIYGYA